MTKPKPTHIYRITTLAIAAMSEEYLFWDDGEFMKQIGLGQ